eukprot:CAMPEP_0204624034 /NCGR_PEP_ID=MMETSP0717-20131115/9799_1 /ASSEMBLY_ACC=CAM_ASM_000666 /TAXON_ID=230516 /ORGANISM="Chaetoceros curvisetus" /LENGTH=148 /DNA_ID=CAMNT_0051639303 /DNA_START=68 /DNA_END=514 /DNA_ORIENTATION=-
MAQLSMAFTLSSSTSRSGYAGITTLKMGLFDGIMKAFDNEEYGAPPDAIKATARHILVPTVEDANMILDKLQSEESSFTDLAKQYSTCPSGRSGGALGSFQPGTMVPEFDKVIFSPDTPMGAVMGPVETKFGQHLIVVDKRTGGGDWY